MLDERFASALSGLLDSTFRIEVDEFATPSPSGQLNLTRVASQIQATLNELDSVSADELASPRTIEEGGFRIVWHARQRREGEDDEPVIV